MALLERALGAPVTDVRAEMVTGGRGVETERVTYVRDGVTVSLLLERFAADDARDVKLLPFLGRKTDRVPVVQARGEPHVTGARHWLLREDTGTATACDAVPLAIIDAKLAIERAVVGDGPALKALGVPLRSPSDIVDEVAAVVGEAGLDDARLAAKWLRRWPVVLCHGDLRCDTAALTPRGAVLTGWRRAHLGCGLVDVVRLSADLGARGHAILGVDLPKKYAEAADVPLSSETLRAAELIERLERRHLRP